MREAGPTGAIRIVGFRPTTGSLPRRQGEVSLAAAESPLSRMLREGSCTPPPIRGVLGRAESESEDGCESSGSGSSSARQSYDDAFVGRADQQAAGAYQQGASVPVGIPGSQHRRRARPALP